MVRLMKRRPNLSARVRVKQKRLLKVPMALKRRPNLKNLVKRQPLSPRRSRRPKKCRLIRMLMMLMTRSTASFRAMLFSPMTMTEWSTRRLPNSMPGSLKARMLRILTLPMGLRIPMRMIRTPTTARRATATVNSCVWGVPAAG